MNEYGLNPDVQVKAVQLTAENQQEIIDAGNKRYRKGREGRIVVEALVPGPTQTKSRVFTFNSLTGPGVVIPGQWVVEFEEQTFIVDDELFQKLFIVDAPVG